MKMRDLKEIRDEIDAIDTQLAALFQRRMAVMDEVAQAKKASGVPTTDSSRENDILNRLAQQHPDCAQDLRKLYALIFSLAKDRQSTTIP